MDNNQDDIQAIEIINEVNEASSMHGNIQDNSVSDNTGFGIDSVLRITLSAAMQNMIDCVIGINVTSESPWNLVDKQLLDDIFDSQEEMSKFSHIGGKIKIFPGNKILIGYDIKSKDGNQFFLCTTEAAQKAVEQMIQQEAEERQRRIQDSIERSAGQWNSLGSENEINELILREDRPLKVKSFLLPRSSQSRAMSFEDCDSDYVTELESTTIMFDNLVRNQLDAIVQVSSELTSSQVQTDNRFPINMGTITEFAIGTIAEVELDSLEYLKNFLNESEDEISYKINQTKIFDIYRDEFFYLDDNEIKVSEKINLIEYQTFTDVEFCKGKMISSVSWHPMWDGIIAIAYTTTNTRRTYISQDHTSQNAYCEGPVLIWSFKNTLHPKLILDCPSEVHDIQFCTFNENLLIGGCKNGQILIWDITNRLEHAEKVLPANIAQAKCQQVIGELMSWIKDTMLLVHVQPCVSSSLQFSHKECVFAMRWLHPSWHITTTGNFDSPPEGTSLEFITAGEDGNINMWDMKAPIPVSRKTQRKKQKVYPKAFDAAKSSFSQLDQIFQPIFAITVNTSSLKLLPISALEFNVPSLKYHRIESSKDSLGLFSHKPILEALSVSPKKELSIGSFNGSVNHGSWNGFESTTKIGIMSEVLTQNERGNVHDGPVYDLIRSPFYEDIILSIGGKTFAIWKDSLHNIPIMWKISTVTLTGCAWSLHRPSMFFISKSNGSVELWDILVQSHKPLLTEFISGGKLTCISTKDKMFGVADYDGSFKIFSVPPMFVSCNETDLENARLIFEKESYQKNNFLKWQANLIEHEADIIYNVEMSDSMVKPEETVEKPRETYKLVSVGDKPKKNVIPRMPLGQVHPWSQLSKGEIYRIQKGLLKEIADPRKKTDQRITIVETYRIPIIECPLERKLEKYISQRKKQDEAIQTDGIAPVVVLEKLGILEDDSKSTIIQTVSTTVQLSLYSDKEKAIREELDSYLEVYLEQSIEIEEEALAFIKSNPYNSNLNWKRTLLDVNLYT